MKARFSLGIDLGTSNCAMALTDLETDRTEVLPIAQILAANQLGEKLTLASALYLPHPEEFRPGSFPLPWNDNGEPGIVGQFAICSSGRRASWTTETWMSPSRCAPRSPASWKAPV